MQQAFGSHVSFDICILNKKLTGMIETFVIEVLLCYNYAALASLILVFFFLA